LAVAERFAAEGMPLAIADIEEDALDAAAKQLTGVGADGLAVPTDTSNAESVDALAGQVRERYGFTAWETPLAEWKWVLGVNLSGVINGIRAFVPRSSSRTRATS
jgi:NAD(P)-dependent dehydrogenase (short-subunit alcohol dehydrogenase family)